MKIVVASGKGGVGKSMVASSLSVLFAKEYRIVACDCDVDAPNLGLWLGVTEYDERKKVTTSEKAFIKSQENAKKCGLDPEICRFGAISIEDGQYRIDSMLCEGCGLCAFLCPTGIEMRFVENGEIRIKKNTKYGFPLIDAQLGPGETGSGKLVEELKKELKRFEYDIVILDSAAGTGCPVISSVRGSDFALIVTEPTPAGISDMKNMLKVIEHFKIPFAVVINKYDLNEKLTEWIEENIGNVVGKIRYDKDVIKAIVNLTPVVAFKSDGASKDITEMFERLRETLHL